MKIITGYQGRAHIASKDDQGRNRGMMGAASYVLGGVNTFAATLVSNNELQIGAGEGIHQGVHFRVEPGSYDSLTIENGTQGKKRKDLIVCRYTKDSSTGVENTAWVAIKGTPADSSPVRPAYTSGDIASGAATADMPFYELTIDGINVTAVTPLFSVLKTMKELQDQAQTNANAIASLNSSKLSKDAFSVITGTVTTSASGTAALSQTYSTAYWGCLTIMVTDASVGYMLIPYKYGDAAGGRWGLKAILSGNMTPLANTSVTYTAIMFRYTDVG